MGTPAFSAHLLSILLEKGYEIEAVFTKPDTHQGRGKKMGMSAVKHLALAHNLPIYQPTNLSDESIDEIMEKYTPDFLIVAAYGKILPKKVLDWAKIAPINVHASLLPYYRGAAPIQWSVRNGDKESGISIMKMEEGLDSGPIYQMAHLTLAQDETTGSLFERLALLSGEILPDALESIKNNQLIPEVQDETKVTFAPMFDKGDEKIDWTKSANEVRNLIHALSPSPGAYTYFGELRVKLYKAELSKGEGEAGSVIKIEKNALEIACGEGAIRIMELQPSGKKLMAVSAFLNGNKVREGSVFN